MSTKPVNKLNNPDTAIQLRGTVGIGENKGLREVSMNEFASMCQDAKFREAIDLVENCYRDNIPGFNELPVKRVMRMQLSRDPVADSIAAHNRAMIDRAARVHHC